MATLMGKSHGIVTQAKSELAQCKNIIPYDCTHNCTPFPKKTEQDLGRGGGQDEFPTNKR